MEGDGELVEQRKIKVAQCPPGEGLQLFQDMLSTGSGCSRGVQPDVPVGSESPIPAPPPTILSASCPSLLSASQVLILCEVRD